MEIRTTKQPDPEPVPDPAPVPDPVEEKPDLIKKANEAAARLEKANVDMAALIQKQEQLQVEKTLGGEAHAGTLHKTKEEKNVDNAKEFLRGTGYEDEIFEQEV